MAEETPKILALQFQYFGDAVLLTPALRAIRERFPRGELHLLVPEEMTVLFRHLPWLNRVWPIPRRRGRASLGQTWPVFRALRRERFDRSVDFSGNDRSAIASFLIGARQRLGPLEHKGFLGRRFCYTRRVLMTPGAEHESARLAQILSGWGIVPSSLEPEIRADPALDAAAEKLLPHGSVICHIATSHQKKEWPVRHWAALYMLARQAGYPVVLNTGGGPREQALLQELKQAVPDAPCLPPTLDRPTFLAVLKRARVFVSGDTGPLHFAAGLGVPTIGLFGPTGAVRWAPVGRCHQALTGGRCDCDGDLTNCVRATHCLAMISPEEVFRRLQKVMAQTAG